MEENIYNNNEMENENNEISDNQHIEFENNESSQIRKNGDKEQIEKVDEIDEGMNNVIAIVDPTKLKKRITC